MLKCTFRSILSCAICAVLPFSLVIINSEIAKLEILRWNRRSGDESQQRPRADTIEYLEIGTQTFDTLAQDMPTARGVSVDMIREYVDINRQRADPNSGKIFLNAAVVGEGKKIDNIPIFMWNQLFVWNTSECYTRGATNCGCTSSESSPGKIELRSLGITILGKSAGCLSPKVLGAHTIWKLNPEVVKKVQPANKAHLLASKHEVNALTPAELMRQLRVVQSKRLKIDAEGYDAEIIQAFASYMRSTSGLLFRPEHLQWECFHLSTGDLKRSMETMQTFGYSCMFEGQQHRSANFSQKGGDCLCHKLAQSSISNAFVWDQGRRCLQAVRSL